MVLLSNECQYFKHIMYTSSEKNSEIISFQQGIKYSYIKFPSSSLISENDYISDGGFLCKDAGVLMYRLSGWKGSY